MAVAKRRWGMVVDVDRCTGCQACIVACQAENNVPLNEERIVNERRAISWIRIERYWVGTEEAERTGDYSKVKARFLPVMCQHCGNAPCEPVCPVYATHRTEDGLNAQIYNRCIGTRYCGNNDPYNVRFFNFWEPDWPETLREQLNPDVTVRSKGVIEKCTFCVQRIRRTEGVAKREGRQVRDGEIQPACVQACPADVLLFGDLEDPKSQVAQKAKDRRHYRLLEELGTDPGVVYLKKVDATAKESRDHG